MRIENKYTFNLINLPTIKKNIHESHLLFSKSYKKRYVNSLYLDSSENSNYEENLSGLSNRSKARIRWYSKTPFETITNKTNIFFEIKIKKNLYGGKILKKINIKNDIISGDSYSLINFLRNTLPKEFLPHIDHCSFFTLGVSYERSYYESFSKQVRLTIDENINFAKINNFNCLNFMETEIINVKYGVLEIKYSQKLNETMMKTAFDFLDITKGRHSKYTVGLNLINR